MINKYIKGFKDKFVKEKHYSIDEDSVITKYQELFSAENLDNLTKEHFKSFLLFKNNKHWSSIYRQGNMITQDMESLRRTLRFLQNEEIDIENRLNAIIKKAGEYYIKGLGRAVLTPILLILFPEKYCVFNSINEKAMKELNIFPKFNRGTSFGEKYKKINEKVNVLARKFQLSLWQMDTLWWFVLDKKDSNDELIAEDNIEEANQFQLEKHLENFIIENWEKINFFKDLEIFIDDENEQGLQYATHLVGTIDILCQNKTTQDIIVIELKKGRSSDEVVGQILRYIGWVEKNLVKEEQKVRGIILGQRSDEKLMYAIQAVGNNKISYHSYEVEFKIT